MQSVLLILLAAIPLAQVLLGCVVLQASPATPEPIRATTASSTPPVHGTDEHGAWWEVHPC